MLELESGGVPDTPILEIKPLPDSLRYEFLGPSETFPIIISSSLTSLEVSKLLEVVRTYRKAIGYSMDDLKGLSPSLCMHRIYMEENHKPSIEHQCRINPNMK